MTVDSVKWVRRDSIVIGCIQVNEDSEETDYMVQVITTKEARFDEVTHCRICRQDFIILFYSHGVSLIFEL